MFGFGKKKILFLKRDRSLEDIIFGGWKELLNNKIKRILYEIYTGKEENYSLHDIFSIVLFKAIFPRDLDLNEHSEKDIYVFIPSQEILKQSDNFSKEIYSMLFYISLMLYKELKDRNFNIKGLVTFDKKLKENSIRRGYPAKLANELPKNSVVIYFDRESLLNSLVRVFFVYSMVANAFEYFRKVGEQINNEHDLMKKIDEYTKNYLVANALIISGPIEKSVKSIVEILYSEIYKQFKVNAKQK